MEKISLYDLLSVLLPGAILTLAIEVMAVKLGLNIDDLPVNQYFMLTIFLSSSIFLGSLINFITIPFLKYYKKIGLYTPIHEIYYTPKFLDQIKPFLGDKMNSLYGEKSEKDRVDSFWSKVYYGLEATEKIGSPKAFQSFYFFFRNFFTLSIILLILLILFLVYQTFCYGFSWEYLILPSINIVAGVLSIFAGKSYRIKMVERMFWTYYSLNNKE